jgi:hypothetical protein
MLARMRRIKNALPSKRARVKTAERQNARPTKRANLKTDSRQNKSVGRNCACALTDQVARVRPESCEGLNNRDAVYIFFTKWID